MANDRRLDVTSLVTTHKPSDPGYERTEISVSVGYAKGWTNWYSGEREPGGYWAYFQPRDVWAGGGGFRTVLGSGSKVLLEEATRFNAKRLAHWADHVRGSNLPVQHPVLLILAKMGAYLKGEVAS